MEETITYHGFHALGVFLLCNQFLAYALDGVGVHSTQLYHWVQRDYILLACDSNRKGLHGDAP